jgi:hypothetical protein
MDEKLAVDVDEATQRWLEEELSDKGRALKLWTANAVCVPVARGYSDRLTPRRVLLLVQSQIRPALLSADLCLGEVGLAIDRLNAALSALDVPHGTRLTVTLRRMRLEGIAGKCFEAHGQLEALSRQVDDELRVLAAVEAVEAKP